MNNKCEGIILRQRDYKDNDMILTILSKEFGRISLIAKGVKKAASKNASSVMPFTKSIFYFNHHENSELHTMQKAESKKMYHHLYDHLEKQLIAELLCEICSKVEYDSYDELYELLDSSLYHLDVEDNDFGVLAFFVAKMNILLGINPNVDGCIFCGSTHQIAGISIYDGGFVCANCFDSVKHQHMRVDRLRYFRLFHKAGLMDYAVLEKLNHYSYEDVESILLMFMEYSGIHLKGMKLLKEIITFEPIK